LLLKRERSQRHGCSLKIHRVESALLAETPRNAVTVPSAT